MGQVREAKHPDRGRRTQKRHHEIIELPAQNLKYFGCSSHLNTQLFLFSLVIIFFFYYKGHIYCVCADINTLPETAQTGSSEAAFLRTSLLGSKAA